jgi:amino acid permease
LDSVFASIVLVVFSMVGAEIATVAAAESHDPEKAIAKATQSVIIRVATFYVGSMLPAGVHRAVERHQARRIAVRRGVRQRWASRTPTTS